jgi:uncharacterized protein YjbI with pentapeptide repeats
MKMRTHLWALAVAFIVITPACEVAGLAFSGDTNTSKVSAEIVINQLRNDQHVIYDHAEIVGDLILEPHNGDKKSQKFKNFLNSTINITNSIFRGNIDFEGVTFNEPVIIEDTVFKRSVSFQGASFLDLSRFNSTTYQGGADFEQAKFHRDASFKNSSFQGHSNFNGTLFMGEANFDKANFDAVSFTNSQFDGYARFGKDVFRESSNFEGSKFSDNASFNQAQFLGKAFLGWTRFDGKRTYFTEADFRDSASFSGSGFNELYFNKANFGEDATFLNSSFEGNASFSDTRFQKDALFYRANFNSNVKLDGCDYGRLVLHWSLIRDHLAPNEPLYNSLIKNYKNLMWISDVNECYFDLRHWKQTATSWTDFSTKISDLFLEYYCGYGTRPLNTLFWIGCAVTIFGLYYWRNGGAKRVHECSMAGTMIIAKKVSEDTYRIEHIPEKTKNQLLPFMLPLLSFEFSLRVLANWNTDDLKINQAVNEQIVEGERWIGRVLLFIFMFYMGSLVISYFTPQP